MRVRDSLYFLENNIYKRLVCNVVGKPVRCSVLTSAKHTDSDRLVFTYPAYDGNSVSQVNNNLLTILLLRTLLHVTAICFCSNTNKCVSVPTAIESYNCTGGLPLGLNWIYYYNLLGTTLSITKILCCPIRPNSSTTISTLYVVDI